MHTGPFYIQKTACGNDFEDTDTLKSPNLADLLKEKINPNFQARYYQFSQTVKYSKSTQGFFQYARFLKVRQKKSSDHESGRNVISVLLMLHPRAEPSDD